MIEENRPNLGKVHRNEYEHRPCRAVIFLATFVACDVVTRRTPQFDPEESVADDIGDEGRHIDDCQGLRKAPSVRVPDVSVAPKTQM